MIRSKRPLKVLPRDLGTAPATGNVTITSYDIV